MEAPHGYFQDLVGNQVSRKFFFENSIWDANESLEHGVIDELVDDSELIERASEVAKFWSSWGPHAKRQQNICSMCKPLRF